MSTWVLGLEFYKNDSGKEMDGHVLKKFEYENAEDFDAMKESVSKAIISICDVATKVAADPAAQDICKKNNANIYAWSIAGLLTSSATAFNKIYTAIASDAYWFHFFNNDEMAQQRKTMFDNSKELESNLTEHSFEEIMGDVTKPTQDGGGLSFSKDAFFNKEGVELNGLPDFWQVQAGLY